MGYYRELTKEDIKKCAELYCTAFSSDPWHEKWELEDAKQRLSDIYNTPGYLGYVFVDKESIRGALLGYRERMVSEEWFLIKELFVNPEFQGESVGTGLLEHLENELLNENIERIYLFTK